MKVGDSFTFDAKVIDGDDNVSYVQRTGVVESEKDGKFVVRIDGAVTEKLFHADKSVRETKQNPVWVCGSEEDFLNAKVI